MCRFLVCELAVHIFEVIVCFGQLFIFSAEGEAGGAIFDGKLHLGYHQFQVLDLSFQIVSIVVVFDAHIFTLIDLFQRLLFLELQHFHRLFQFTILCTHFLKSLLQMTVALGQLAILINKFLHVCLQLANQFILIPCSLLIFCHFRLIGLQLYLQKVYISLFLLQQFASFCLEVLQFLPQDLLEVSRKGK